MADLEQLRNAILAHAYTTQQCRRLLKVLRSFLELYLFSQAPHMRAAERLTVFFERHDVDEYTAKVLRALDESFYQSFTQENIYRIIRELEQEFEKLPSVVLYVAIEFPDAHMERIGAWLRREVDSNLLVKVVVEPDIAAGCAIVKDGVYHDLSFRHFLRARESALIDILHEHAYAT